MGRIFSYVYVIAPLYIRPPQQKSFFFLVHSLRPDLKAAKEVLFAQGEHLDGLYMHLLSPQNINELSLLLHNGKEIIFLLHQFFILDIEI